MNTHFTPKRRQAAVTHRLIRWGLSVGIVLSLQACAVIAVADAAVTVVATGVKVTAKAAGAVAEAVIP